MTLLVIILFFVACAVWILLPLRGPATDLSVGPGDLEELQARHRELLAGLQDLDFELETGKLSPEDHQIMRRRLQTEAVSVLQRLDEMSSPPATRAAGDHG